MKHLSSTPCSVILGRMLPVVVSSSVLLLLACPARPAINIPSNGSDGAFNPAANITVDLAQAVSATWNTDNTANAGKGVYDAAKWAVVFKYSSVNIPAGVTVTFKNHASRAPVVWLVQGDVTLAGTVVLDGKNAANAGAATEPGSGGFRGGIGGGSAIPYSSGFGPASGRDRSGSYGSLGNNGMPPYGNAAILPLIGGSGGSGGDGLGDGGAGGGAILIASGGTLSLSGHIYARGGTGASGARGGSGGAIRLVSDNLTGTGGLDAYGGYYGGGAGRIRIEANTTAYGGNANPTASVVVPVGADPVIWPKISAPKVVVTQIGGMSVPSDPISSLTAGDVYLTADTPVTVRVQATNVPSTWAVKVHVIPTSGADTYVAAAKMSGDDLSSVWEAQVTLTRGYAAVQVRAAQP